MFIDDSIIEEVLILRKKGMSILKISHAISRTHPSYCKKSRHQKNFCGYDVVRILEKLKADGRLPSTTLDFLKQKIGEKGRAKSEAKKLKRKRLPKVKLIGPPPRFF